jgi:hypothetical protein
MILLSLSEGFRQEEATSAGITIICAEQALVCC